MLGALAWRERNADLALLGVAAGVACAGLLLLLGFGYGRDQGIYAVVAGAITGGGLPYRDAWDFKPPGIFVVYALARALGGPGMLPVRMLEALVLLSLLPAFGMLARRLVGDARAGVLGWAVAVLAHVQLEFWDSAQPEDFAGAATVWALALATRSPSGDGFVPGWRTWLGVGALYAVAGIFKPHLGGGIAVTALFAGLAARRFGAPPLSPALWLAAGAALPLAAAALWLAPAHREAYEVFGVFLPVYHSLQFTAADLPLLLFKTLQKLVLGFTPLLAAGVLLLAIALRRDRGPARAIALHVAAVAGIQLLGVALQGRFYAYHYGATLPLLALLAGPGLWWAWQQLHARPLPALVGLAALALLAARPPETPVRFWDRVAVRGQLLLGAGDPVWVNALHSNGDVHYGANRRVAEWLATRTEPDAKLYVWGFEPMLHEMSGRRPASRWIYNVAQRLAWPGRDDARRELALTLRRDPPEAIVVVARDVRSGVTGAGPDSRTALAGFPALRELLEQRYERQLRVEDLAVYTRRSEAAAAAIE